MADYDERRVLGVHCPKCGAEPDERCKSSSGKPSYDVHTLRKAVVYPRYLRNLSGGTQGKPKVKNDE